MAERIKKLLAAADPEIIQKILEGLSHSSLAPYEISGVESLKELLKLPHDPSYYALIIDVDYVKSDLSAALQDIRSNFADLPLVVLVDISDLDTARKAITRGADGFVIKSELTTSVLECVLLQAVDRAETRSQLQESNRQVKNLMDNLPGIAYRCRNDADWTMEFISAGCEKLTGYAVEDLLFNKTTSFNNLIHPGDRQKVWDVIQAAVTENRGYFLEYRIKTANNLEKWVWDQGRLIENNRGDKTLEGFITDITDRRQREFNMQSLIEIGDVIRVSSYHPGMVDKILQKVSDLYRISCSAVAKISEKGDSLDMEHVQGGWENLHGRQLAVKKTLPHGIAKKINISVFDETQVREDISEALINEQSRFCILVPLVIDECMFGFLIAARGAQFSEYDVQAFEAFGNLLSSALERQHLVQRLEKQLNRMESLHTIDQAITGVFEISVINHVILEEVRRQLGAEAADILHFNALSNTLDLCGDVGFRNTFVLAKKLPISTSIAGKVLMERSTFEAPDLSLAPQEYQFKEWHDEGFKAFFSHPLIVKGKPVGVLELFYKHTFYPDRDWLNLFQSMASQAAVAFDSYRTYTDLQKVKQNLANTYNATLETWSKSLELTNIESHGHIRRVTNQTLRLARDLGVNEISLPDIERGALLHDIGKLGILDEILLKKGKLTDLEWHEIEKHPVIARDLLSEVSLLKDAVDIPFSHHENWDGSGYPQGLKGESIPFAARIFTVVETYDALLSDKPYRKAWAKEKAVKYLIDEKGKKFDPLIVDAFLRII